MECLENDGQMLQIDSCDNLYSLRDELLLQQYNENETFYIGLFKFFHNDSSRRRANADETITS